MKNVAIFGAGRIGRIHAANLAALPGVTLKYVCDPVGENAAQLAAQLGARVATPEAVFADPDIDVIAVASPTDTHSDLIGRAAVARKHIFCEKPIDLSVARAEACAQAVKDAGIACMIGFQRRFDPTFNEARERLVRGEIGVPEMLVVTSRDPGAPPAQYLKGSGGIFRDMLIHDFDVFRWILDDEAVSVYATASVLTDPNVGEAGDADTTAVTIRTRKGRLCQINTSRRAAYGYDQRFEVLGSAGMLQAHNHRPTEVESWTAKGVSAGLPESFFLERYRAAYASEMAHFVEAIREGKPVRTTVADGLKALELSEAAEISWREKRIVEL